MELTQAHLVAMLKPFPSGEKEIGWNSAIIILLQGREFTGKDESLLTITSAGVSEEDAREIAQLATTNNKLGAVKKLKDHTGLGLKDAKDVIDKYCEEYAYLTRGESSGNKFNF